MSEGFRAGVPVAAAWGVVGAYGCESESPPGDGEGDTDSASASEPGGDSDSCRNVLLATVRDFNASHPDFERADLGWGPARGLIQDEMGPDRKPLYNKLRGDCQLLENGTCVPTQDWGNVPMWGVETDTGWTAEETFSTWYRDAAHFPDGFPWYDGDRLSHTFEREIVLAPEGEEGTFVFDSNAFFPLQVDEGFGESPAGSGHNFLFTTEIHLAFEYVAGQRLTFRGDDDLWIFMHGQLALDLGGMHESYEATIDFDAQALRLGIVPGGVYRMDIFHAERHTDRSNFRIETNIRCVLPVLVE